MKTTATILTSLLGANDSIAPEGDARRAEGRAIVARETAQAEAMSYTGAKFDRGRDMRDIAKGIRADIAAAVKGGQLPAGLRASVQISRSSMSQSVSVKIEAVPGLLALSPRYVEAEDAGRFSPAIGRYTRRGTAALATIQAIVNAYNQRRGEGAHALWFYDTVSFSRDVIEADRAEIRKGIAARATA